MDNIDTVDKDSEKYKVILKLVNKILINIDKERIDDLLNFKDISRNDIIKEENIVSFDELQKELFTHYDKSKCGWYRRKTTKHYIITFLRYALDEINLKFTYYEVKKQTKGHVVSKRIYSTDQK